MNRIREIVNILEDFFQKGPQGLSSTDDQSRNSHLEDLFQSMGEKVSQPFKNFIKGLEVTNLEELPVKDFEKGISNILEELEISEILQFIQNVRQTTKENLESIFYLTDMFEKNLYEKINPILTDLSRSYPEQFMAAVKWLHSAQGSVSNYTNEAESIMLIHDELMAFQNVIDKAKLSDLSRFPDKIVAKVEKLDSDQYKLFFKDWALKFSSLIETKFKNIFIFLNYFWKLEEKEKVSLAKLKNKMIGAVFSDFKMKQNFKNIDRFRVYRNKTFHAGVQFKYDENWKDRYLIFDKNLSVTITEFLLDFTKLFRFLNTFIVMVEIIMIKRSKVKG